MKSSRNFVVSVILPCSILDVVERTKPETTTMSSYLLHLINEGRKKQVGMLWLPYPVERNEIIRIAVSRVWYDEIREYLAITAGDRKNPHVMNNYYLGLICLALNLKPT